MKIESKFVYDNKTVLVVYEDTDSFELLDPAKTKQAYGVCFYDDKIVIVLNGKKNTWGLVGGTIEKDESYEDCLIREIKEESNMNVLKYKSIGYQAVYVDNKVSYQLRYFCTVEPYGDFIADPDGEITEIKSINPEDYKQYFDWGEIGDRIMERAVEMRENYKL